jgi:hypothetical protein
VRSCGCLTRRQFQGHTFGDLTVLSRAPNIDAGRLLDHPKGFTSWFARCVCGRTIQIGTATLLRQVHPSCGCRGLKPSAGPPPAAPWPQANGNGNRHREHQPAALPRLTAAERAAGWHDSQLGRTRRVDLPVTDDDDDAHALCDFDPNV